jgi:hypothetical protein
MMVLLRQPHGQLLVLTLPLALVMHACSNLLGTFPALNTCMTCFERLVRLFTR